MDAETQASTQAPDADGQAAAAEAVEATGAPLPDVARDGAEGDPGAVGAPEVEAQPDTLEAFLARNAGAQNEYTEKLRERENAGAQRREQQLRREAGKKEPIVASVNRWLKDAGLDGLVDDPAVPAALFERAQATAFHDFGGNFAEVLKTHYAIPAADHEAALAAREAGEFDAYVGHLLEGAVKGKAATLRLADVPEGSQLRQDIQAEVNKRLGDELKAKEIEAADKHDAPPRIPRGQAVGTRDTYAAMSGAELARLPDAEYERAKKLLVGV